MISNALKTILVFIAVLILAAFVQSVMPLLLVALFIIVLLSEFYLVKFPFNKGNKIIQNDKSLSDYVDENKAIFHHTNYKSNNTNVVKGVSISNTEALKEFKNGGYVPTLTHVQTSLQLGSYSGVFTGNTTLRPLEKTDNEGNKILLILAQVEVSTESGGIERFNLTINESDLYNCVKNRKCRLEVSEYQKRDIGGNLLFNSDGKPKTVKGAVLLSIP